MFGKKKNNCKHNFKDWNCIVLEMKFPRMVSVCSKCGLAVHRQVYSTKRIKELEGGSDD